MEVYNNRIAISYSELTSGDRPILSDAYWKQLKYRKQVMVVRRGCRGVEALIDYESSPAWLKKAYTDKYGSPELKKDDSLRKLIRKDEKAEQFYMRYAPTGKDYATLGAPYIYQYTQDASVLNAVIELERSMKATIGRTGGSTAHVWKNISTLVNNLQSEFGCKLPNNAMALKRKVAEYQISGYASLVSNRFGNKSASKTKKAEQEALMVELLGNGRNIDNAMISRLYNKVGERCGWPRISERTVANYKQKHPESYAGRHGASAYYNNKAMQVKRTRPSTPMLMWCADGWDTELLYQEASRDRQGRSVTTYHKRPTVVAVIDTYSDYIVGYAIGKNESPALIREAWRNAFWHIKELFGTMYKPFQIQTDNYAKKALTPMFEASAGKAWTPAAVGNAKAKPVEPFFLQFNRRQFRMMRNSSGYGVKTSALKQPSVNFINDNKKYFPDWDGVCEQVRQGVERERADKKEAFIAAFAAVPETERTPFPYDEFLRQYGERTDAPHKLHGHGIVLTIDGHSHSYDCFHPEFRNFGDKRFILAYDPNDMHEVIAIAAAGTLRAPVESGIRFTLEEKYAQPMALADRKPGDFEQLQRIREYNAERVDEIIELRRHNAEVLNQFYDENQDKLSTDTTVKMLITDSRGQHKDERNIATGRAIAGTKEKPKDKVSEPEDVDYEVLEFDPRDTIRNL